MHLLSFSYHSFLFSSSFSFHSFILLIPLFLLISKFGTLIQARSGLRLCAVKSIPRLVSRGSLYTVSLQLAVRATGLSVFCEPHSRTLQVSLLPFQSKYLVCAACETYKCPRLCFLLRFCFRIRSCPSLLHILSCSLLCVHLYLHQPAKPQTLVSYQPLSPTSPRIVPSRERIYQSRVHIWKIHSRSAFQQRF